MNNELNHDAKVNRRTAILAIIALILLLAAGFIYRFYGIKKADTTNTANQSTGTTDNSSGNPGTTSNQSASSTIGSLNQQIQSNPTDPNLYAQKSEILYNSGDKAGALSAVNEGLATNPDSEILKSKKDVLEKDYFQSSNTDAPRQ